MSDVDLHISRFLDINPNGLFGVSIYNFLSITTSSHVSPASNVHSLHYFPSFLFWGNLPNSPFHQFIGVFVTLKIITGLRENVSLTYFDGLNIL